MATDTEMRGRTTSAATPRRSFLKLSTLGAGFSLSGGCGTFSRSGRNKRAAKKNAGTTQPPKPPRFGFIGVGGIGRKHLQAFSALGVHVAALCDVDERELYSARDRHRDKHPGIRVYKDFRVMLANTPELDAVVISTPDHGHGMQAVQALRRGAHVFLETPLVHTHEELDVLEAESRKAGRIVLPGDCGCCRDKAVRACEVFRSGVLGEVAQVHIWTGNPVWPQGGALPAGSDPVPESLDWQLWLCGARPRPFKRFAYHKFNWRGWTDFGGGTFGDVAGRLMGFPFKALQLEAPREAQRLFAIGGTAVSYPGSTEVRFLCDSARQKKPVELLWYDGMRMPRAGLLAQVRATVGEIPGTGTLIIGRKGSWFVRGSECEQHYIGLNGGARMTDLEKHELWSSVPASLPRNGSPQELFLRAIRDRKGYDFTVNAHKALNRTLLCGTVAQQIKGPLEWNERKKRFEDNEDANKLLQPHLEPGWEYYQG